MTDTSHIVACRQVYFDHLCECNQCYGYDKGNTDSRCEVGAVAWDEMSAAILCHPGCENLTAEEIP